MIRQAVLLALGARDPRARVAGLPLIKRALLTLQRAGVERAYVVVPATEHEGGATLARDPDYRRVGIAVEAIEVPPGTSESAALAGLRGKLSGPFLVATAEQVCEPAVYKRAAAADLDAADVSVCVTSRPRDRECGHAVSVGADGQLAAGAETRAEDPISHGVLAAGPGFLDAADAVGAGGLWDIVDRVAASGRARALDVGEALWLSASGPAQRARAERELLSALGRSAVNGPISRWLNKPVSLVISRQLVRTSLTPNQMTLICSVIGFVAVWFVLRATWASVAVGCVLLHVQSVLDGCDGEIARLKFQQSRLGAFLDHFADGISNITFGLALGWVSASLFDAPLYWWLAVSGAVGYVVYDTVILVELQIRKAGSPFDFRWWFQKQDAYVMNTLARPGLGSRIVSLFHACGRRDVFCFAWMLLGLVGLPQVAVIWFCVIGSVHGALAIVHALAGGARRDLPAQA